MGFLKAVGNLLVFVPLLLWISPDYIMELIHCPGWILYALLLLSLMSYVVTHGIGKSSVNTAVGSQRYGADFRYLLVQVRDNSEQIAMSGAEECEKARLVDQFAMIRRVC